MENFNRKNHWENIYSTKELENCSWYQPIPSTSLSLIEQLNMPKTSSIIDIGGGDSYLIDNLIEKGYSNLNVLDISESALNKAKKRLGEKTVNVNWICGDASSYNHSEKYDIWHDRAAFHFLTSQEEINQYIEIVKNSLNPGGILIIGTFSETGPKKCSGIEITQYSPEKLTSTFSNGFIKLNCENIDHVTPFNTIQNFTFCSFKRAS